MKLPFAAVFTVFVRLGRLWGDPATVVDVHDGDTITCRTADLRTLQVRVAAIDAPELLQDRGSDSRLWLRRELIGKVIDLREMKLDRYGRTVGRIFEGREDVALLEIKAGLAWFYRTYDRELTPDERANYARAETDAKARRVGLWRDSGPVAPWVWRHRRR